MLLGWQAMTKWYYTNLCRGWAGPCPDTKTCRSEGRVGPAPTRLRFPMRVILYYIIFFLTLLSMSVPDSQRFRPFVAEFARLRRARCFGDVVETCALRMFPQHLQNTASAAGASVCS